MTPLEALQSMLAAEHAAVHVLATLGAVTSSSGEPELHALLSRQHATHRGRREQLFVMIRTLGGDPVPAEPAYALPTAREPREVRAAATLLEQNCASTYAAGVASTVGQNRTWASQALRASALALLEWGATPTAFPGTDDLGR